MPENRLRFTKLYSFSCFRSQFRDDHSQIGERGFSRVVHCNDLDSSEEILRNHEDNYISTTKYTVANFVPKSLFEQFRRVANFYFLVVAAVSYSPLAPYRAVSVLLPLTVVIAATMAKEGVEDWKRRKQDVEVNNRKVLVLGKSYQFEESTWKSLKVGDIVRVFKDEYFPSDLLLLSSSYDDGICYVETMNLDGETNLKMKNSLSATSWLQDENSLKDFKAVIKCEDPNDNLYSFVGTLHHGNNAYPLSMQQVLLRDSKLKNTEYVNGLLIFTGHDTKVMQNTVDPPSKRSNVEKRMDKIIYLLFIILIFMASTGSVFFAINTKKDDRDGKLGKWYLRPDMTSVFFRPRKASLGGAFHFFTALMLYNYLIPISLYISIEVVKVLQSIFINQDRNMYYEETDRPARARTSNLNEELGQVDTILSDKTGTLTCNSMDFVKCSIGGVPYGDATTERKPIKGFNFHDERILYGNWVKESQSRVIQSFFRVFALCNMAVPAVDRLSGERFYEAESPDEAALVTAAREVGFELIERSQTCITLSELDRLSGHKVKRVYDILQVLDFTSSRKRMSIIVRSEENRILLVSKGADSVMFERLCKDNRRFEHKTKEHIKAYAEAGLRTLVIAFREVEEDAYRIWEDEFLEAKTSVNADREAVMDSIAEKIERDLVLLGSSAVEDKLQMGVTECINKLSQAGIKIWVLTGDKMETAVNVGYACNLLRPGMTRIYINLESPEISSIEKEGNKSTIVKASFESVRNQITEGVSEIAKSQQNGEEFALIIDGKSLAFALDHTLEKDFLFLALRCASVICCRSTPKHKALVTRLVKNSIHRTTLAIGDGANDVGMLQEADIGVGISGVEGMQAVMASDYAIAQFRFLERLLLVHGHWCYKRIAMMICYFFYKNLAFAFSLFFFEAFTCFSGLPAYNDWYLACYNVLFTSLPVIALGVFDQDVSARLCLRYPLLYQEGIQNVMFTWRRITGWMCNGVITAFIIFFMTIHAMAKQAFRRDGRVVDYSVMGVTLYSCVVWSVNCQMAISISYFTWIQHFVIWGSIVMWYIFLVVYGVFPPSISTTAFKTFVETCALSPHYWFTLLVVVVSSLLPMLIYRIVKTHFRPTYLNLIQASRLLPLPSHTR